MWPQPDAIPHGYASPRMPPVHAASFIGAVVSLYGQYYESSTGRINAVSNVYATYYIQRLPVKCLLMNAEKPQFIEVGLEVAGVHFTVNMPLDGRRLGYLRRTRIGTVARDAKQSTISALFI